jgi:hypothetical protein
MEMVLGKIENFMPVLKTCLRQGFSGQVGRQVWKAETRKRLKS